MSEKRFIDLLDVTAKSEADSPVNGAWLPITNFREATLKVELTVSAGTGVSITPKLQTRRGSGYNTTDHFVVNIGGETQGQVTILVQLANNADVQTVGDASVVFDQTPPPSPTVTLDRGAAALVDGYTNDIEQTVHVVATIEADTAMEVVDP